MTGYNAKVGMRKPKTLIPALRGRYIADEYHIWRYGMGIAQTERVLGSRWVAES